MIRAILLKGLSQYDALRLFAEELYKSFIKLKVETVVIDMTKKNWIEVLENELRIGCNFVLAFNGIGSDLRIKNNSIYNVLGIPYIGIYVDHPIYHIERLSNNINKYIVTVVDKKHIDFLNNYFDKDKFLIKKFLPHGGIENKLGFNEKQFNFRNNNILFSGTYKGIPVRQWLNIDNLFLKSFIEDVFNARTEFMSIEESVDYVIKQRNMTIRNDILNKIKLYSIQYIDAYDKSKIRFDILKYVLECGINIDIYGNGSWNEISDSYTNANYKGDITMNDLIGLYSNYKVTLNDNNNFRNGSHERIFNAVSNGCQCITSKSSYYDKIFDKDKSIIKYSRNNFENLDINIKKAIKPEAYYNIRETRQYVLNNHLWINRAQEILNLYQMSII
ncbi:glycosyltransferase family protein [Clostridium tyrobutyricum]|uniref:glycosyltransferase family protein n=1 Tax=Clostridium tyrobutyricum TaxID=1519 RepID=UPI0018AB4B05